MDQGGEYHDPDYSGTSQKGSKEVSTLSEEEKLEKIRNIVRREFSNELEIRENEVMQIDQRLSTSRHMLHRLRYSLVESYYNNQRLQLSTAQAQDEMAAQTEPRARVEVCSLLRDGQRRLHPSVRKLLGKRTADLDEILLRSRAPRSNTRKDYSAMIRSRNYTIASDTSTKTLRSEPPEPEPDEKVAPKKVPRHLEPKIVNVVTLDEATRNQLKYRYRIIIGNTSKYAPAASRVDKSTHKWLLYVRGPRLSPDLSAFVTAVNVTLHHSYAPHHLVHLDKPPFHISRRGWGEFPAKVELHFALPERNRPAIVEHTIKLDRNYTGLQTLGAETIVDVWLYSTPEMLKYEFREDMDVDNPSAETDKQTNIQTEDPNVVTKEEHKDMSLEYPNEGLENNANDSWLDFFSKTTELDVDEMIIKPEKKTEDQNEINNLETSQLESSKLDLDMNSMNSQLALENAIKNTRIGTDDLTEQVNDLINVNNQIVNKYKTLELQEDLPNELLNQETTLKKRIMKYIDPNTGKIYYLEMDRKLDLSKVQEIVINSNDNVKTTARISPIKANGLKNVRKNSKKGVSLLKPEVKNQLKVENNIMKDIISKETTNVGLKANYTHIENDHCYLASPLCIKKESINRHIIEENINTHPNNEIIHIKKEISVYECLCVSLKRFTSVRMCVNYLLNNIPVISSKGRDPDYVKHFPFTVETEQKYWRLDFAKRRNIEWSRAKLINKLITDHFNSNETIWRTKQILIYSRLHGYHPVRAETSRPQNDNIENQDWSSWLDLESFKRTDSDVKDIDLIDERTSSLIQFDSSQFTNLSDTLELTDSDEEIEIVKDDVTVKVKKEVSDKCENLTVLPVESEEDRLRFLFIEKKSADIGIELRNEDVGSGYSYSAVHAVILSAVKSFASELLRGGLAERLVRERGTRLPTVWMGWSSSPTPVPPPCIQSAARRGRLAPLLAHTPAAPKQPPITKPL